MKNRILKLSRKGIIFLAVATLLIFSGVAYGAGQLIVHFGGGVGVSGSITVVAPLPTTDDVLVLSTPQFTIISGSTDNVTGVISVQNNSAYGLRLDDIVITLNDATLGTITLDSVLYDTGQATRTLAAHSTHDIPVFFKINNAPTVGDYSYQGELYYSW